MLPALAQHSMWAEVEDTINGGWSVNATLKVTRLEAQRHVCCHISYFSVPGQRPHSTAFRCGLGKSINNRNAVA